MAVDNPQVKFDPYQSNVPLVQLPQELTQPSHPDPGQFGRKGTGALDMGDKLVKGFLQGHEYLAKKKYAQATATIAAADKATEDAYNQYQDSLSSGKDPALQQASYQQYIKTFQDAKAAKAQFILPQKPEKGKKGEKPQEGQPQGGGGFGAGIKDFLSANPHIVPQIALATMQPKPPGQSREGKEADLKTKALETQVSLGQTELTGEKQRQATAAANEQRAESQRKVESSGGVDAVLADKGANPELQQTARQMKFAQLDAQSPEGKMKTGLMNNVLDGSSKDWTPQQRMLAGAMGVAPMPAPVTVTGKGGHQQQILVDPTTNQPIPGTKPLDLGPPAWAGEFYAKRAADHADMKKAVEGNPEAFGVTPSADPKAMKAAIDAKVSELIVKSEFGIRDLAGSTGKTGYEIQRDNDWLSKMAKEIKTEFPKGEPADFTWTGGQKVTMNPEQMSGILEQFLQSPKDTPGIYGFRSTVNMPQGKDPQAVERDRQWVYQRVKNQMMLDKGKNAMSPEQIDKILEKTSLGRPITDTATPTSAGMTRPPARGYMDHLMTPWKDWKKGGEQQATGGMTPPPQGPTKMYMVTGYDSPVELTDAEVKKAKAANIPLEEVNSSINQ